MELARSSEGSGTEKDRYPRDKVSWATAISYGIGSYGANVMYAFIAIYLMLYYTDSFGIKAAAVGLLFLIARLLDGATDIALGILVDNTHTKMGKFRPWILIGSILVSLTTVACFLSPDLSEAGKLAYAYSTGSVALTERRRKNPRCLFFRQPTDKIVLPATIRCRLDDEAVLCVSYLPAQCLPTGGYRVAQGNLPPTFPQNRT